jgi:hypothetical protein
MEEKRREETDIVANYEMLEEMLHQDRAEIQTSPSIFLKK